MYFNPYMPIYLRYLFYMIFDVFLTITFHYVCSFKPNIIAQTSFCRMRCLNKCTIDQKPFLKKAVKTKVSMVKQPKIITCRDAIIWSNFCHLIGFILIIPNSENEKTLTCREYYEEK